MLDDYAVFNRDVNMGPAFIRYFFNAKARRMQGFFWSANER
jgi:hypothetical protein